MGRGPSWRRHAPAYRHLPPKRVWATARRVGARRAPVRAEHASILDGRTLRLSGHLGPLAAGSGASAPLEVWLRRQGPRGRREAVRLCAAEVERHPGGGATFAATAVLAVAGGGRAMAPEDWNVYVREPGRGLMAVGGPPPERDTGPTLLNPRSPETGLWYRLRTSPTGRLALRVTAFPAHAEVERVEIHLTELTIEGRVVGTGLAAPAGRPDAPPVVMRFSDGGNGEPPSVPVRLAGDGFSARADPERFTVAGGGRRRWLMELAAPGAEPLVLGRYLDDMRRPASAYRYPGVTIGSGSPNATRLLVTYADDRRLVLDAAPAAGKDAHPWT